MATQHIHTIVLPSGGTIPDTDDQTASQVPMAAIPASTDHVVINGPNVQKALDEISVYIKDRPTLSVVNTALSNYANAFNASQDAQDAQIGNLQNGQTAAANVMSQHDTSISDLKAKKRAWGKGVQQTTNNDDVDVADTTFRLGKTYIGSNADDGTERKLQVDGGVSVKGDSKIGNFFVKQVKLGEGYFKILDFSDLDYQSFFLQLAVFNDSGSRQESLINCRIHGDTYGYGSGFEIYSIYSNNQSTSIFPNGIDIFCIQKNGKIEIWAYSTEVDNGISFTAQSTSLQPGNTLNFNYGTTETATSDPSVGANVLFDSRLNLQNHIFFVNNKLGISTSNPLYSAHVNGTVAATSFVTLSSAKSKEKEKFLKVGEASKLIMALPRPVEFQFKDEYANDENRGKRQRGYIADNMPELFTKTTTVEPFVKADFDKSESDFESEADYEKAQRQWEDYQNQSFEAYQKNFEKNDGLKVIALEQLLFTVAASLQEALFRIEKIENKKPRKPYIRKPKITK